MVIQKEVVTQLRFTRKQGSYILDVLQPAISPLVSAVVEEEPKDPVAFMIRWLRANGTAPTKAAIAGGAAAGGGSAFEGAWARRERPGVEVASVSGGVVHWRGGGEDAQPVHILCDSKGGFSIAAGVHTFRAELRGGVLRWNDGEVWVRPHPEAQGVAPQEAAPKMPGWHALVGAWEYPGGTYHVTDEGGVLKFKEDDDENLQGPLHLEGDWMVADMHACRIRLRLGPSGNSATSQFKGTGAADWEAPVFAIRRGTVKSGTKLVTTQVAGIVHPEDESEHIGIAPPGTLLVAIGPIGEDASGLRVIPLRPTGGTVELVSVRLLEPSEPAPAHADGGAALRAYTGTEAIFEALSGGDTVLLRGRWLRELARSGGVLPRRQELPKEAIWKPSELRKAVQERKVELVAVSYRWLTKGHPDPQGAQLRTLGRAVRARLAERTMVVEDLAVFVDWCSLHQAPRRPDQAQAFARGLKTVHLWYAHADTSVWTLSRAAGGAKTHEERGWPFFEHAVSSMLTDGCRLLNLGAIESERSPTGDGPDAWHGLVSRCTEARRPPLAVDAFSRELGHRAFTCQEDRAFLCAKYRETYAAVLATVPALEFRGMHWGPAQVVQLAEALPDCALLHTLVLSNNPMGEEGVNALARSLPKCPRLKVLDLSYTGIGDAGAEALSQVLPQCPCITELRLMDIGITDWGAELLAGSLDRCPNLCVLQLNYNTGVETDGIASLVEAAPNSPALRMLSLEGTHLSVEQRDLIMAAWQDAGMDPELLHL